MSLGARETGDSVADGLMAAETGSAGDGSEAAETAAARAAAAGSAADGVMAAETGSAARAAASSVADGLVTGNLIECPKHNGCFDFKTGEAKRLPVRQRLATFPVKVEGQTVYVQVENKASQAALQISYDEDE